MAKLKALVFYTYLPPWRIDVFNEMGKFYELTIVFLNADAPGFTYNQDLLLKKLEVDSLFWNKGFNINTKAFRFGIWTMLQKYKPDVVFTHEFSPTSILLASYLKLNLANYKLVVTTSDNKFMAEHVSQLKFFFRKYVLNSAKGLIVYSSVVKDWYQKTFERLNIKVCPNIQDPASILKYKTDFPGIAENYKTKYFLKSNIILYVGRLEKVKGLDLLLQAFSMTVKDTHQLVLVGDGSYKDELVKLALKYNITDRIVFPGYFDDKALYAWYYLADFFVLPSRYEPFGAVVNEALVLGCPVLASKHIGALDYIDNGNNGIIFDPENLEEFNKILLIARDKFIRKMDYNRNNLMLQSFNDYVNAFEEVIK